MTLRAVRFHPAAMEEVEAAADWYQVRSNQAAARFLSELERTIQQIAVGPERFARRQTGTRVAVLRKFPYAVVFRDSASVIEVIAVAHGRRRPGYWRARLM